VTIIHNGTVRRSREYLRLEAIANALGLGFEAEIVPDKFGGHRGYYLITKHLGIGPWKYYVGRNLSEAADVIDDLANEWRTDD
jgi:hypothetical protein